MSQRRPDSKTSSCLAPGSQCCPQPTAPDSQTQILWASLRPVWSCAELTSVSTKLQRQGSRCGPHEATAESLLGTHGARIILATLPTNQLQMQWRVRRHSAIFAHLIMCQGLEQAGGHTDANNHSPFASSELSAGAFSCRNSQLLPTCSQNLLCQVPKSHVDVSCHPG